MVGGRFTRATSRRRRWYCPLTVEKGGVLHRTEYESRWLLYVVTFAQTPLAPISIASGKLPLWSEAPEVFYVLNKMQETGVDMYLDVHGDEALPYNFVAGSEGNPGYTQRIEDLENQF